MLSWRNKLKKQLMTSIASIFLSIVVEFGASHAADSNIMLWWEYLLMVRVLLMFTRPHTERAH